MHTYQNRQHAGRALADALSAYENQDNTIVLGLPRGGVPVAAEVATALNLPLDIFVVRKLGTPGHEEMAMGAIASGGVRVLNQNLINSLNIASADIQMIADKERHELQRRESAYRDGRSQPDFANQTVIVVDDGMATGATMKATVNGLKQHNPAKIIVALPVGSEDACRGIGRMVDQLTCLMIPEQFRAVGHWYETFGQTTDDEVRQLLQAHQQTALTS